MTEKELPQSIQEKYRLLSRSCCGGSVHIFNIQNRRTEQQWVLRVFEKQRYEQRYIQDCLTVYRAAQKIQNPCFQQVAEIEENEEYLFVVLEYLPGVTLSSLVQREGPRKPESTIALVKQLLGLLQELRRYSPPVVFRALEPEDIICTEDGKIKLFNSGNATVADYNHSDYTCLLLAAPGFQAPEEYAGLKAVDERTDIFHIGMMFFYMATGIDPRQNPYYTGTDTDYLRKFLPPSYPKRTVKIISRCTTPNPAARYQSYEELESALEKLERRLKFKNIFNRKM